MSGGLLAQSVGGGGGNGGGSLAFSASGGETSLGVSVGLGGDGKAGGDGGVYAADGIWLRDDGTEISLSQALALQQQGEHVSPKDKQVSVKIGMAEAADDTGTSSVPAVTKVATEGMFSGAIVVQSVGGGGGNGGFDISASGSLGEGAGAAVDVGLGGDGDAAGEGRFVEADIKAIVSTDGRFSNGIAVQSVGGGGGSGGFNVSAAGSGGGTSGSVSVGLGGSGGAGGNASDVTATYTGPAYAAWKSVNDTEDEVAAPRGSIDEADLQTKQDHSTGIVVQSVGGGGGNGGFDVAAAGSISENGGSIGVGIGGAGGSGGTAGRADFTGKSDVSTADIFSPAIVVQSIGGGGGNGGVNVSATGAGAAEDSVAIGFGLGGSGGDGNTASAVFSDVEGNLTTTGDSLSPGLVVQSVGGGGGNGGVNVDLAGAAATNSIGASVGLGGLGGTGARAGTADSDFKGTVETQGIGAPGIVVQSVGGGGGNGGLNFSGSFDVSTEDGGSLAFGLGGAGGDGATAGRVDSGVIGDVKTTGNFSPAIFAQSLGGGGGNGAINISGTAGADGSSGGAIGVGIGGLGGTGSHSDNVKLAVSGDVVTSGIRSHGVVAQSVGGGGGNGGLNITGSLNLSGATPGNSGSAAIGIGGSGAGGGDSGDVDLEFEGNITVKPTTQNSAAFPLIFTAQHGILAQSVGGGGGSGGVDVAAGLSYAGDTSETSGALVVGIGGSGGDGGNAGRPSVPGTLDPLDPPDPLDPSDPLGPLDPMNLGDINVGLKVKGGNLIDVSGSYSTGVLAQSVGGGGGSGGVNISGGASSDTGIVFGLGGSGGAGGTSGKVKVNAHTDINTNGNFSPALTAQSVGGGGGNGAFNFSGSLIGPGGDKPVATIGVGGSGGEGSTSGVVELNHLGTIDTKGSWSHGVLAQSVAGGGGNGGADVSATLSLSGAEFSDAASASIVVGVGGDGAKGADAENVTLHSWGDVTTEGYHARGLFAQSLGGGGGNGGTNVTVNGAINSNPVTVGVGGSGDGGGHAGEVHVTRYQDARGLFPPVEGVIPIYLAYEIDTNGVAAHGIEASSIGGGGGDAGVNVDLGGTTSGSDYAIQVAIGGGGADAGNGALTTVENRSSISTFGAASHGIFAQSLGGGGGNANVNLALAYSKKGKGLNVGLGGATGKGGVGGEVRLKSTASSTVVTSSRDSIGLFAQSIGGGGGNAGFDLPVQPFSEGGNIAVTIGREGASGGEGGLVHLESYGTVQTFGAGSHGMLAQSLGNGGGNSSVTSVAGSGPTPSEPEGGSESGGIKETSGVFAWGKKGGEGGHGGDVRIDADGYVSTTGRRAHAIYAQSIGGGGGNGGAAGEGVLVLTTVGFGLGGEGGTGAAGGTVTAISKANTVNTTGDDSIGIFAQSVGGGGGAGGAAYRAGVTSNKKINMNVVVGGKGGGSGTNNDGEFDNVSGGVVHIENHGNISTDGARAYGVLGQSVGGGGGIAGLVANVPVTNVPVIGDSSSEIKANGTFIIGGEGGEGSGGNTVSVDNTGSISTLGEKAVGIFAQSIGGGGGISSTVLNAELGRGGQNKGSFIYLKAGGAGGAGGDVTVTNKTAVNAEQEASAAQTTGVIHTEGEEAHGILAMSVGGAGGDGGHIYNNQAMPGAASTEGQERSLTVTLGGSGGEGGTGGLVTVDNQAGASIVTRGDRAHGLVAQSVGGGGGNASLTFSDVLVRSQKATTFNLAAGGSGGAGNHGGDVKAINAGKIETYGVASHGIFAQSIGGGGGSAGQTIVLSTANPTEDEPGRNAYSEIGIGGSGGDAANSGDVSVIHSGEITTYGDNTYGVFAQAVGGGGGAGRNAFAAPTSVSSVLSSSVDGAWQSSLGGKGSSGVAGSVSWDLSGSIETKGHYSKVKYVNRVDDGGGDLQDFNDLSQSAGFYASDCDPDHPDAVCNGVNITPPSASGSVALINHIVKLGNDFFYVNPDTQAKRSETLDLRHAGTSSSSGDFSGAEHTQNIASGGGNHDFKMVVNPVSIVNINTRVGSTNSPGRSAGGVNSVRDGDTVTYGDNSPVSTTQSIGGGGGTHTVWVETVADGASSTGPVTPEPVSPANSSVSLGLGAEGGGADHGGDVTLDFSGNAYGAGERSPGLIVQTIGAGGGVVHQRGVQNTSVTLGGIEDAGGDGGDISLVNQGGVYTDTDLSNGVLLQSIGGGGGFVLTDTAEDKLAVELSAANTGNGGDINFTQTGDIIVRGDESIAVIAQSLGGGGGLVDRVFAGAAGGVGDSGSISLTLAGDIEAPGQAGVGVWAQSLGSGSQGDIDITLAADSRIYGGFDDGVGVWIDGGNNNHLVNYGTILTDDPVAGVDGKALLAGAGDERVDNYGVFYGEFDLGGGSNSFENHEDGMLVAGFDLELGGAANRLINDGSMMLGDSGFAQPTNLSGSFTQSATGASFAELDFLTGLIDELSVTGTVDLGGRVDIALLNPQLVQPGQFDKVMFSAEQGLTNNGAFLTAAPSLVISYKLVFPDAEEFAPANLVQAAASTPQVALLEWDVDFAPEFLDTETTKMGRYFNRVQAAGSSPELANAVIGLLYESDPDTYSHYLEQLSPEFYAQQHGQLVRDNQAFGERMLSCKQAGGEYRFTREGSCIWLQADYDDVDISEDGAVRDSEFDVTRLSFGVQKTYPTNISFGVAVSTADVDGKGDNGSWNSDSTTNQFGLALKYRLNAAKFSAALTYGKNDADTRRRINVLGATTAKSNRDMTSWGGLLRYTHDFGTDGYYLRPGIDLGFSRIEADGAREKGAEGLSLVLEDNDETHSWVQPSIEAGMDKQFEDGKTIRFYGKVGVQEYLQDSQAKVFAEFSGAPAGIQAIEQEIDIGETTVHAMVGVDLLLMNEVSVQLQYRYSEADELEINSGHLKISMPF
ncbi:MAG: autotransporter outer membrane beta-barrel domain-containing protein [Halieaceae bacterium]